MTYSNFRRVGIYIDGTIYLRAYQYYLHHHELRGRIDIGRFIEFIFAKYDKEVTGECVLVEKHFVRKHTSAAECKAGSANGLYNDRVFEDILLSENITLHNLPVIGKDGQKAAKGLEMQLAMKVLDAVIGRRIDTAILLISDANYLPLLWQLKRYGINIVLLSWEFTMQDDLGNAFTTATSDYLKKAGDICFCLDRVFEEEKNTDEIHEIFTPVTEEQHPEPSGRERAAILSLKETYGFLEYPGNNLYFHASELPDGLTITDLTPGDIMEFEKGPNPLNGDVMAVKITKAH